MKKNILLVFILLAGTTSKSQTPKLPLDKSGKVEFPVPKIQHPLAAPAKVAFEAVITAEQPSPRSPIRFDVVKYNVGNSFFASENAFIVPDAGLYFFSLNLNWNGYGCEYIPGGVWVSIIKNGRGSLQDLTQQAPGSSAGGGSFNTILAFTSKLNAGDKITISVVNLLCTAGGGTLPILRHGVFSGYRIYSD
jgi:C1q domain